ncbi:hypothetical protein MAPG_04120 [Magnaporthiopsis poae ATCC 64411]|uniref:Uncharacterized protein n=1 Tax=Magnaporthiopsis poae (strain ATCC 64411 / 73-15) TaxID=644358 RepID=A0A0C4DVV7_MAGP6|nr:hypothetical protein MAPG_04120 [Magnaporthiopsis poae ATCC 64411]
MAALQSPPTAVKAPSRNFGPQILTALRKDGGSEKITHDNGPTRQLCPEPLLVTSDSLQSFKARLSSIPPVVDFNQAHAPGDASIIPPCRRGADHRGRSLYGQGRVPEKPSLGARARTVRKVRTGRSREVLGNVTAHACI